MMHNRKFKADIILIACLLTAGFVLILSGHGKRKTGADAVVSVEGKEQGRYSLSIDGEYMLNGGTNVLIIENGTARISDADCPDKLCIKQGKIKYTTQCITCLPNKLTVTIEGAEKTVDFIM